MNSSKIREYAPGLVIIALFLTILTAGLWSVISHSNSSLSRVQELVTDRFSNRNPSTLVGIVGQETPNETSTAKNFTHYNLSALK